MSSLTNVITCLCCGSSSLKNALDLNKSPLTDQYRTSALESLDSEIYPLNLALCTSCSHLQLTSQVSAEQSYEDYIYQSSITLGLAENFLIYAKTIQSHLNVENIALLDIGSNDGSFIQACRKEGIRAYGIEPSKEIAALATLHDCPTLNSYFSQETSTLFSDVNFPLEYDIITFNNVLANLPSPIESLKIANSLLKDSNSFICIQTGYHPKQFAKGLFDYIYHEHYSYFNISSMYALACQCGLYIHKIEELDLRGGSIRFILKKGKSTIKYTHERFTSLYELNGLYELISASSNHLNATIDKLKTEGNIIAGYGASHSTGILVHHFQLASKLDFLVDENKKKQGLFMPGTDLLVYRPECINLHNKSFVVVVLAWQYFEQIRRKLIRSGFTGMIIKPVLP